MIEARNLAKRYPTPAGPLTVLEGVDLELGPGESASIVGPSGNGKSTLLYILGTLEPPTSGTVRIDGRDPFVLDERSLALFRNREIGFVFQDHHLLPQCSVLENVLVPALVDGGAAEAVERARWLLERVGLTARLEHRPGELSGGEKQRVALARALVRKPRLLLCDEPTGNLDHEATASVASLLLELHATERNVLLVVTHNPELAAVLPRRYRLADRRLLPA
jgi:lipoprotein-releasing system ATP-binding protein